MLKTSPFKKKKLYNKELDLIYNRCEKWDILHVCVVVL